MLSWLAPRWMLVTHGASLAKSTYCHLSCRRARYCSSCSRISVAFPDTSLLSKPLPPDGKKKRRVAGKNHEGFAWRTWFLTGLGTLLGFRACAGSAISSAYKLETLRHHESKVAVGIPRGLSTCSYNWLGEELFWKLFDQVWDLFEISFQVPLALYLQQSGTCHVA